MNTVLSLLKLFAIICAGLIFFLGEGWLVIGPLFHFSLSSRKRDVPLLQEIPLALLNGFIINYGMTLLFQTLKLGLVAGMIISIFGLCCFALYFIHSKKHHRLSPELINILIGISLVSFLFLFPIIAEPLTDWDARSIWFFHAKMIYAAGSIGQAAGWQLPSINFSHPDYPNLVPALAAQVATLMGYWNEFIPKISLFFIFVPAIILLFTFARRSFSFVILLLLIPCSFYSLIWNGYMDGYFALYFSVSMLLLGRYLKTSQPIDMVSSMYCLSVLLYLKNEGVLAVLAGLCSTITAYLFSNKKASLLKIELLKNWKYAFAGLFALLPFLLWNYYALHWGLSNDLGIGTTKSFLQIITRLQDGSVKIIFHEVYTQLRIPLLLSGMLYFVSAARKKPFIQESIPAFMAAGVYCVGIIFVYFITPKDLVWHLSTSISRTMLSVNGCFFVGSYFFLNAIENDENTIQ